MARIQLTHCSVETCLRIAGRLTADDLGRLEHACRHALTTRPLRLVVDVRRVTRTDAAAVAYLARMEREGATIQGGPLTS